MDVRPYRQDTTGPRIDLQRVLLNPKLTGNEEEDCVQEAQRPSGAEEDEEQNQQQQQLHQMESGKRPDPSSGSGSTDSGVFDVENLCEIAGHLHDRPHPVPHPDFLPHTHPPEAWGWAPFAHQVGGHDGAFFSETTAALSSTTEPAKELIKCCDGAERDFYLLLDQAESGSGVFEEKHGDAGGDAPVPPQKVLGVKGFAADGPYPVAQVEAGRAELGTLINVSRLRSDLLALKPLIPRFFGVGEKWAAVVGAHAVPLESVGGLDPEHVRGAQIAEGATGGAVGDVEGASSPEAGAGGELPAGSESPAKIRAKRDSALGQTLPRISWKFIRLQDMSAGFIHPCLMDIKMGTTSVGPDYKPDKAARLHGKDDKSTTTPLGFRISGFKVWEGEGVDKGCYREADKAWGKSMNRETIDDGLKLFFSPSQQFRPDVAAAFVEKLEDLRVWMASQSSLRLFSSSLLFVYDGAADSANAVELRIIDFAHIFHLAGHAEVRDSQYLFGLDELLKRIRAL